MYLSLLYLHKVMIVNVFEAHVIKFNVDIIALYLIVYLCVSNLHTCDGEDRLMILCLAIKYSILRTVLLSIRGHPSVM